MQRGEMNDVENHLLGQLDALIARRRGLYETLSAMRAQIAEVDRQIADCGAAARVFGIELPGIEANSKPSSYPGGTIRELAQVMLADSPNGMSSEELRAAAEKKFNRRFHYKSAGVALYRLANEGLAKRDGHVWFATAALSTKQSRHD